MPSYKISVRIRSSKIMTDDARPEGVIGFVHKKLPHINAVVIAIDIEQSIFPPSKMLFRKIFAFSNVVDFKNSFAVLFISIAVTLP